MQAHGAGVDDDCVQLALGLDQDDHGGVVRVELIADLGDPCDRLHVAGPGQAPSVRGDLTLQIAALGEQRFGVTALHGTAERLHRLPQFGQQLRRFDISRWAHGQHATGRCAGMFGGREDRGRTATVERERDAQFGELASMHRGRGLQVDASETRLVGAQLPQPRTHRLGRHPGLPTGGLQARTNQAVVHAHGDRVLASCPGHRCEHVGGQGHVAGRDVRLGRQHRRGAGQQSQAGLLELVAQPQPVRCQPTAGTTGGQVGLQQGEFGAAPPRVVVQPPEPVPGPAGVAARAGEIPADQGASGALDVGLADVVRSPVVTEQGGGLGERGVRLEGQAGLGQDARPVEQEHATRDVDGQSVRLVDRTQRQRQVAAKELQIAQVVQGLELADLAGVDPGDLRCASQVRARGPEFALGKAHRSAVEQNAELQMRLGMLDQPGRGVEGGERAPEVTAAQFNQPTLAQHLDVDRRVLGECGELLRLREGLDAALDRSHLGLVERDTRPDPGAKGVPLTFVEVTGPEIEQAECPVKRAQGAGGHADVVLLDGECVQSHSVNAQSRRSDVHQC